MTHLGSHHGRSDPPPPPVPPPTEAPSSRPGRGLVLLVDDIEDCRDVYGQFLRHAGYDVVEAGDGNEALAKATALKPDAIVMDLWMPHLDGWESIRRLKAAPATARIPVLVLTGDAYAQARRDAEAAGCQAYLVKPCLPMDVAAEVGRLLAAERAGASAPAVRVMSERRAVSRRRSETSQGILAALVADVEARVTEASEHLRALEEDARGVDDPAGARLRDRLHQLRETQAALGRHVSALNVITRSADVKITIPARRGPRKP